MLGVLGPARVNAAVMNELSKRSTTLRLVGLLLVLGTTLSLTAMGGMYLASYATHLVWLALSKAPVRSVEDFPAWLWIPATAITASLIWLVSYILQKLKLPQRIMGNVNKIAS
jgi:hypothetical protein